MARPRQHPRRATKVLRLPHAAKVARLALVVKAEAAMVAAVDAVKAAQAAVLVDPAARVAASANISVKRKSASSASKRWT
jgi:hypothetical protein